MYPPPSRHRIKMGKYRIMAVLLALGLAVVALPAYGKSKMADNCVKFEGSAIGQEDVELQVDGITVSLLDWRSKVGEPGEYAGFSFDIAGGFGELTVKAGRDSFKTSGATGTWLHPEGDSGRSVKGISNVVVCVSVIDWEV